MIFMAPSKTLGKLSSSDPADLRELPGRIWQLCLFNKEQNLISPTLWRRTHCSEDQGHFATETLACAGEV